MIKSDEKNIKQKDEIQYFKLHSTLFTDLKFRKLSAEAKILYSLMRARWFLSRKNNWTEGKKVYIFFTVEEITQQLNCGSAKAIRILNELDIKKGIGLIERKNQGLGKPSKIFVKDFDGSDIVGEKCDYQNENPNAEPYSKTENDDFQNGYSELLEDESPEFSKSKCNNKENNYINNNININQSYQEKDIESINRHKEMTERIEKRELYGNIIKSNINFDTLKAECGEIWLNQIVELMLEVVCSDEPTIVVGKEEHPAEVVKERFWELDESHIGYVYHRINTVGTSVRNIRAYLITALYHSAETADTWSRMQIRREINNAAV